MSHPVKPGTVIDGYQGGLFGRDSYGEKVCVDSGYSDGEPWAVFRELSGWGDWRVLHGDKLEAIDYDETSPL